MYLIRASLLLALSALLALPALANQEGVNLIQNAGAEDSAGSTSYSSTIAPAGWSVTGTFSAVRYDIGDSSEMTPDDSEGIAGGTNLFWGGRSAVSTASQTIDISALAARVDAGINATLSAYIGGYLSQADDMVITATFLDLSGNALGSMQIGPATAAERANKTTYLFEKANIQIPAGSRSVHVMMVVTRSSGTSNDGYADNLRFVIGEAASTTSNVLNPQTTLEDPPAVTVKNRSATLIFRKFKKASLKAAAAQAAVLYDSAAPAAKKKKLEIVYVATVSTVGAGTKKNIKKTAKKNSLTIKNLAPGNYTVSYQVRAVQGKKVKLSTNVSPAATFTVQ
jgi:hypothetical protein